jgi:hypothetical protein
VADSTSHVELGGKLPPPNYFAKIRGLPRGSPPDPRALEQLATEGFNLICSPQSKLTTVSTYAHLIDY